MVNYNLPKKCTENVWNKLLDSVMDENSSNNDDIYENNNVINDDERDFIIENKKEFN